MTELTLTPEQQLEQKIQESEITLTFTVADAEKILNIIAELPYSKVSAVVDAIIAQARPQAQKIREELTAQETPAE